MNFSPNNGRQTMIRMASIAPNPRNMDTPFMYIHEQFSYPIQSIYRQLITQSPVDLGTFPDTFPNTISEYYWIQEGEPTVRPWAALGKLNSGLYFYYVASCESKDGNFFSLKKKTGIMHLWMTHSYSDLINWAMDISTYEAYISSTVPNV